MAPLFGQSGGQGWLWAAMAVGLGVVMACFVGGALFTFFDFVLSAGTGPVSALAIALNMGIWTVFAILVQLAASIVGPGVVILMAGLHLWARRQRQSA